jgi:hypothetical protein
VVNLEGEDEKRETQYTLPPHPASVLDTLAADEARKMVWRVERGLAESTTAQRKRNLWPCAPMAATDLARMNMAQLRWAVRTRGILCLLDDCPGSLPGRVRHDACRYVSEPDTGQLLLTTSGKPPMLLESEWQVVTQETVGNNGEVGL